MPGLLLLELCFLALFVGVDSSCSYHSRLKRSAGRREPLIDRERRQATCSASDPYRKADGSCNNINNPTWGASGATLKRHTNLGPIYNDDIGTPRKKAISGNDLPNPRTISEGVHFHLDFPSRRLSLLTMQWGQFIDHDITKTPTEQDADTFDCCSMSDSVETNSASPCMPIHVPNDDSYYNNGKCINQVRSTAATGTGTSTSNKREQYNSLSAFIDASMIYGITDSEMDSLRDKSSNSGLMKVKDTNFLPEGPSTKCYAEPSDPNNYCFLAGDDRVNAFAGLSAMHTLFLREHNRIAAGLKSVNSTWDDEKYFQQARKIVAAELQVITYNEWLPLILGDAGVATHSLEKGKYSYDSSLDPSFYNIFTTAAFRFGHSMVSQNAAYGSQTLPTVDFFKRTKYVRNGMDDVILGQAQTASERADAWYVDDMRNRLFETDSSTKDGWDIVALNIKRGRDHGLPGYNKWREHCGLTPITTFTGSTTDFGLIQGRNLSRVYEHVDDIDIYSGGIAEIPETGAAVGKTYICLLGETFKQLRDGDRFWYENRDSITGFDNDQVTALEGVTLAKVICANTGISDIQANVFRVGGSTRPCSRLVNNRRPLVDLDNWKNE